MTDGILEKVRQWFKIMRHYGGIKNTFLALYRYDIINLRPFFLF